MLFVAAVLSVAVADYNDFLLGFADGVVGNLGGDLSSCVSYADSGMDEVQAGISSMNYAFDRHSTHDLLDSLRHYGNALYDLGNAAYQCQVFQIAGDIINLANDISDDPWKLLIHLIPHTVDVFNDCRSAIDNYNGGNTWGVGHAVGDMFGMVLDSAAMLGKTKFNRTSRYHKTGSGFNLRPITVGNKTVYAATVAQVSSFTSNDTTSFVAAHASELMYALHAQGKPIDMNCVKQAPATMMTNASIGLVNAFSSFNGNLTPIIHAVGQYADAFKTAILTVGDCSDSLTAARAVCVFRSVFASPEIFMAALSRANATILSGETQLLEAALGLGSFDLAGQALAHYALRVIPASGCTGA